MNTPPPGHNANDSMLSGGTEPIVGVMGGGTRKNYSKPKNSRRKSRRRSRRRSSAIVGGARNPFDIKGNLGIIKNVEIFNITHGKIGEAISGTPLIEATGTAREKTKALQDYSASQRSLWKRHGANGIELESARPMMRDSCPSIKYDEIEGQKGVGGSDRMGLILPKTTSKILLLPPCDGNQFTYTKCIKYMESNRGNKDTVFIFTPPFYSTRPGGHINNIKIRDHYITVKNHMKKNNLGSVYILCEYTENSIFNACLSTDSTENLITPLLEPTYIVFPNTVQLDQMNVSGILFSAAAGDEVILPGSGVKGSLGLIQAIQNGVIGEHAWPPNMLKNDSFLESSKLPYRTYRFFSKKEGDVLDMKSEYKTMTIVKLEKPGRAAAAAVAVTDNKPDNNKKFEPSEKLFLTGVSYTPVPLGSIEYSLRHPRTQEVVDDWKNLVFTEDEADFLNDLNLRPHILADIYSSTPDLDWKSELAKNMATIVRSKCFKDPRLVLHSDCQASNTFIQKVLDYYVENDARISALEFDEEEAEKNELRLKVRKALEREKGVRKAPSNRSGFDNDPFADSASIHNSIRRVNINIFDPNADFSFQQVRSENLYIRTIVLFDRDTDDKTVAELYCKTGSPECPNTAAAKDYLEHIREKLMDEYPRYEIFP